MSFLIRKSTLHRPRAADLLTEFIRNVDRDTVTLADLMAALGHRAFGVAILVLGLANVLIAHLPGISTILSVPVILISLQMIWGSKRPWLPKQLTERKFRRGTFERMINRAVKVLTKIEVFIKPRLLFLSMRSDRFFGFLCLMFSFVLALPILFGNWLPAWGLVFIALGMIERDGLIILLGMLLGLLGTAYALAFYSGVGYVLDWLVK